MPTQRANRPGPGEPRFIVLEGLDGAGTTTLARLLADRLRACDLRVHLTREPSDGPVGTVLRDHVTGAVTLSPQAAALAFTADRADHLDREVRPALREGGWVVSDRYMLSTLAYQGAEGIDAAEILSWSSGFEVPGLTLFLDTPQAVRAQRMESRSGLDRYEQPSRQEAILDAHLRAIEMLRRAGHRIEVLDGTRPPEELAELACGLSGASGRLP